ncbi:MAG: LuxR C-terminal-related transcriptional regulator [Eubacteriaceae bacterium]
MNSLILAFKKYKFLIFILGFSYSGELIFPAFGPVLNSVIGGKQALYMSSWSMIFLISSFIIPTGKIMKIEKNKYYLPVLVFIVGLLVCFFFYFSTIIQWVLLAVFGFTIGRIAINWSRMFLKEVPFEDRGKVMGLCLFVCYGFLYIGNVIVPSIPKEIAPIIPGLLLWFSMTLYIRYEKFEVIIFEDSKNNYKTLPWSFFGLIFMIYITAGITYAGVYPEFMNYKVFERYYNVLPFVLSALIAGHIADVYGRKYLLYAGIALLGFSFTFHTLPYGIWTYFLTQTTLQSGWAFLDTYVWIMAGDMAVEKKNPRLHIYGVAAFLSGTIFGSFIAFSLSNTAISVSPFYGIITHMPLFAAVTLLLIVPEIVDKRKILWHQVEEEVTILHPLMAEKLTPREKEVAELLIRNKSGKEICDNLYISNNTLKTHSRNIYKKLGVSNKRDLQEKQGKFI